MSPQFKNREEYEKWKQSKLRKGAESADRELESQLQGSERSKSVNQHFEPGKEGVHPSDEGHGVISASPRLKDGIRKPRYGRLLIYLSISVVLVFIGALIVTSTYKHTASPDKIGDPTKAKEVLTGRPEKPKAEENLPDNIYLKWVDGKGNAHYTQEIETIPKEYRSKVEKIDFIQEKEAQRKAEDQRLYGAGINARVYYSNGQIYIANMNSYDWVDVKLEINPGWFRSGYYLKVDVIKAGYAYSVGVMQFANNNGERFNPFSVKPRMFSIVAHKPNGKFDVQSYNLD